MMSLLLVLYDLGIVGEDDKLPCHSHFNLLMITNISTTHKHSMTFHFSWICKTGLSLAFPFQEKDCLF